MKSVREQNAENNCELSAHVADVLNDQIDRKIETYDKEICYKNAQLLNKVKRSAIKEYKLYMDQQVLEI